MEKFIIVKDGFKHVKRFKLQGRILEFKLKPVPTGEEPIGWIKEGINQIINKGMEGLRPEDQVGFSFYSKEFTRGEGWVSFRPTREVTYDDIWDVISSIYQSNSAGLDTDTFCLGVTSVRIPIGKGKDRARHFITFEEECKKRKGIISIKNKDKLCLPRALIVAIAHVNKDPEYRKVLRDIGKLQTQKTNELLHAANVSIPEEGAGIPELQQFQHYLTNYNIVVYKYGTKGREVIFNGASEGPNLNLLHHRNHYNVITSLTAAFCCGYYCEDCNVPYDHKNNHRCGRTCPGCLQTPACPLDVRKLCEKCHRWFRGETCYGNHLKDVCAKICCCTKCFKVIKSDRSHICGEIFCKICKNHVPSNHFCYMQPDKGNPKIKDILFVFYDLETRQETIMKDELLLHEPNLCVFKQCCYKCLNTQQDKCSECGIRLQVLKCSDPITPFLGHVLNLSKKFKQTVVIAHNGQAFDHQFILNYILTKTDLKPGLIMRGTKLISMTVGKIKFLDSLNYFPMALAKLPKAFGLGDNFKKGYFPHLFNTTANANYVGSLPPIEYYEPDNMKVENRTEFLKWYDEHKMDKFDMQKELKEYCISDVEILTAACLRFRQQLMGTGNVCPFTEAVTIASACNKVYRRNFLKSNTVGIIPKRGYRLGDKQSKIAIQWLVWEEKERNISIIHAAKELEAVVHGIKVDGYAPETKQVFEFHGCYFHGCKICCQSDRDKTVQGDPTQTLNTRYEATLAKTAKLKGLGYDVIEMWECNFRKQLKDDKEMTDYTENHAFVALTPLDPRDSFYGGRTGNTVEYYKCQVGETIKYVDVCSLYPWVCKYGKFPVGHPKVYVGEDCKELKLELTEGVIKCKILPPQDLLHPVLPAKFNKKLMFVLCRTCGEQMNQKDCHHNIDERALRGTWVMDEINKALEMGYKLLDIYEVWSYEDQIDQFDKITKTGGLFTEMMNKFISAKQQASGWPAHCISENQKVKYIQQFYERENVMLEDSEIVENPGLRSLAKLMLNSFWGKLGQRENQPKTSIVREPKEFFTMLTNPNIYVNSIVPINEETLVVNWQNKEEAYDPLPTVNVVIAAYVTAQARLKLYGYLDKLGDRVLYYDTDSIIYISKENDYTVPTGEFLGDMTDELEEYGPGSYITEFVSGGPKNYAYKVFCTKDNVEKVICKVKGISLNYLASQVVNFESIKKMVLDPSTPPLCVSSRSIRRTKEYNVVTAPQTKQYKPLSTKRRFLENHCSVPYGFKKMPRNI